MFEIETQLAIGEKLGYSAKEHYDAMRKETARIGQMLNGLMRSVRPVSAA